MKQFYSVGKYTVKGRDSAHVVTLEPHECIKIGETIILDGEKMLVEHIQSRKTDQAERQIAIWARNLSLRSVS